MSARGRTPATWWAQTLAGIACGFVLALLASALLVRLGQSIAPPTRTQLAMWLMPPVWLGVAGGVYFFPTGRHAWAWLGGVSLLGILLFYLTRP